MPKWIVNRKRRHSKDEDEEEEEGDITEEGHDLETPSKVKASCRSGAGASGASLSSDSGRSLSPDESSESDSEKAIEENESSLDWRSKETEAGQRPPTTIGLFTSAAEDDNMPLDLSLNGPLGTRTNTALDVLDRCFVGTRPDGKVRLNGAGRTSLAAEVPFFVRIKRPLLMLSQQNQLKNLTSPKWHFSSRDLRLLSKSFPADDRHTRGRRLLPPSEDSIEGEGGGQIPEAQATPEALAQLERIENKIGDYNCMLCGNHYENAFDLANHNCSCIVKVIHRCPECNKVFQCPANLASHRRWHGIRGSNLEHPTGTSEAAADAAAAAGADATRSPQLTPSST